MAGTPNLDWLIALFEQAPVAIGFSRDGVTLDANERYLRLFGIDAVEKLRGRSILEQIAPSHRPDIIDRIKRRAAGLPIESRYETRGLRADGSEFPFEIAVHRVVAADGPLTMAFAQDLTDRKRTEAQLADALELRRSFIAASAIGILVYRATGPCVLANEAAARMIGGSRERLALQNFRSIASWHGSGLLGMALGVLETDRPERRQLHLHTTFGKEVWIDCDLAAFWSAGERHLLLTMVDVSESVGTESALRASEERNREILEQSAEGILLVDENGQLLEASPSACTLLGRTRTELLATPFAGLFRPGDPQTPPPALEAVLAGTPLLIERNLVHRDGHLLPVELSITGIVGRSQRLVVAFLRDISARKRLDELRNEFLSIAAHELRTPVTVIKAHVQMLERWKPGGHDAREGASFAVLRRQSDRLSRLVQDLLEVSRLQLGRLQLRRQALDLPGLVERVVEAMRSTSERHTLVLERGEGAWVLGDPERLEEVVMNLLDNALRYSPGGGEIRIRVSEAPGEARIDVQDSGLGIPAATQARIFERFFRAHAATASDYGGMGIGLSISKNIVELHGGRIWFESREQVGSTFHVALPLGEVPDDAAR